MDPFGDLYIPGSTTPRRNQRQRSVAGDGAGGSEPPAEDSDLQRKKLLHRDLERQRRQEMAGLFATLRDLLPLEYIKGKRAVSDQINGAVGFIRDTQERIKELSARKEELLRRCQVDQSMVNPDPNMAGSSSSSYLSSPAAVSVMVQLYPGGVEVVVSCPATGFEAFPLSRTLKVICSLGLEPIYCLSTRGNERLIVHTIQLEVSEVGSLDMAWLQQKLIQELSNMS